MSNNQILLFQSFSKHSTYPCMENIVLFIAVMLLDFSEILATSKEWREPHLIYISQESLFMVLYIKNPREPQHNLHKENSYCYVSSLRNVYGSHKI